MIPYLPTLNAAERAALARLLEHIVLRREPPLLHAVLFGSKARGDFDRDSDVDLLLICDMDPQDRDRVGAILHHQALAIEDAMGVAVEPWAVAAVDLEPGFRTPMLVDALDDGLPLWPPHSPPLRLPFTPADACFCAECLLGWVAEGGPLRRWALRRGIPRLAARRSRDDITRLATAALLLTGDTRHRRIGSLRRFRERILRPGPIPSDVDAALRWAAGAYPSNGDRGREPPAPTGSAVATAARGVRAAALMEEFVVPWIRARARRLGEW